MNNTLQHNALTKCDKSHEELLLTYLRQEAVRNTFLIGDILNYGFEHEIQDIWADIEDNHCNAVYLWFCNNLLIYSHRDTLHPDSLNYIIHLKTPDQVMAKRVHLEQISSLLDGYHIKSKSLLAYYKKDSKAKPHGKDTILNHNSNASSPYTPRVATLADVDMIYDFLQSGELAPLYRAKAMIENRIRTGEGTHLLIEDNHQLIAQVNSAASTPYSTMIGGLFTKNNHRNLGIGSQLIQCLCNEIISSNRVPCLITTQPQEQNLFYKLGFQEVEEFTTLEPK